MDAGDASADHQHAGVDIHLPAFERLVEHHAADRGAHQILRLGGGRGVIGMHPGVVLADVHHLQEKRVQTGVGEGLAEGVLVQQRRAGGHYHAIQLVLANVLDDEFLARVRAHVLVVARHGHVGQAGGVLGHGGAIHYRPDIGAAVTNIDADADGSVGVRHSSPPPRATSSSP